MLGKKLGVLLKLSGYTLILRRSRWSLERLIHFDKTFNFDKVKGKVYRSKHKINKITMEGLDKLVAACERCSISKEELLKYPSLFNFDPNTLEMYKMSLIEAGFTMVTGYEITHYSKFMNTKISLLKGVGHIAPSSDVPTSFLSHFNPIPDIVVDDLTDSDQLITVHHAILTRFLKWKFNIDDDELARLFRIYRISRAKSFRQLNEIIQLALDVGFTLDRILKYAYILVGNPVHTKQLLKERPHLAGVPTKSIMYKVPRLMGLPLERVTATYDLLKKAGIPDEAIRRHSEVFTLSPTTVEVRLNELQRLPDVRVLFEDPNVVTLIVSHNQIRSRLAHFRERNAQCKAMSHYNRTTDVFDDYVREGKDQHSRMEVLRFFSNMLKTSDDTKVKENLRKHPFYLHIGFIQIKSAYTYLQKMGFRNHDLIEAIQILLYPVQKLQSALRLLRIKVSSPHKLTRRQQLNLMLYLIEKDYQFEGNGVWPNDCDHND